MKSHDKTKPFCFWLGTSDPHRKYALGSGVKSGMDASTIRLPAFCPDHKAIRSDIADYYFEVQRGDRNVGNAMALLNDQGELDNTIVVMTGDHGMPFPRCKGNLYDCGGIVPMAIRWGEKVKPNRRLTDFMSTTNLAPTFLDAAGLTVAKAMSGRSLLPILLSEKNGRVDPKRDFVVYGRERHTTAQKKPSNDGAIPPGTYDGVYQGLSSSASENRLTITATLR